MTLPTNPSQPNVTPVNSVYTPSVGIAAIQGGTQSTDGTYIYAPVVVQLTNGSSVIGHVIVDSGSITANAGTNLNTSALALESGGNLAAIKSDADTLVTNTTGLATQTTLASCKTDLDTISTNLNQLATSDSLTIASIPVFIPGMSNGSTGAERLHSIDGVGDGTTFGLLANGDYLYNGTGWDKARNNLDNITVLASASRTTTQTQADQTNYNHRGIIVVLNMTVVGTGSVTLEIDGKDPVSGTYYAILTGTAVTTNSTNIYRVYPGLTASANATANDVLPRTWRIKVTANNSNAATYSVGAMLLL
jgi:hypothetical protein